MITKRNKNRERGAGSPQAHRGRWRDLARRMAAMLTATALGLGITVYGANPYAPVQITDPEQFPTIKIETNLVLDEATELPAEVTLPNDEGGETTYGFVEVGLRVTRGAEPYKQLRNVGVVLAYSSKLIPITWTERDPETWAPKEDKEVNSDTGEESTVQNFRFLAEGEKYLPAKKADIMDTASARIIGDDGDGWTAFTMVAACDDPVTLKGDSRLMVVRFAYEKIAGVDADSFELTYVTEDSDGNPVNQIKRVTGRNDATGAVESSEPVELLRWATDANVDKSTQAGNSAVLVGAADRYTVYYAHNAPNPNDPAKWPEGEPDTQGYKVEAVPEDGTSTASMLTASAVELPDEPSTVYDTGDDTVYDLTGDTEPETPEEEPEEEELPESEEEEETSFFEELPMLFTSPRAGTAEGSYQTNFFPVDPEYIESLSESNHPWATWSEIKEPKIQFVDIHRPTADSGVGGISLDDVVPVIFFDWDDTFLGSTVIARGIDSRESVNNFVRDNLIHPDLRTDFRSGGSLAREFSYRGVEPHKGPGEGNTVTDGEQYPLTNKLDYVFYGDPADVDPYLFDDGWVWVENATEVQNTWTTLGVGELSDNDPSMLNLIDFKADVENLNNNVSAIYVKALYEAGEWLDYNPYGGADFGCIPIGNVSYYRYAFNYSYVMRFSYARKNVENCGVRRLREPAIKAIFTLDGGSSLALEFGLNNAEEFPVEITAPREVASISYQLVDKYNSNFYAGDVRSTGDDHGMLSNYDYGHPDTPGEQGTDGFVKFGTVAWLIDQIVNFDSAAFDAIESLENDDMWDCNFKRNASGSKYSGKTYIRRARGYLQNFAQVRQDESVTELPTWEQIQYILINGFELEDSYITVDDASAQLYDMVDPADKWW